MKNRVLTAVLMAMILAALSGCSSTSTSTTEVNVSTTTDEGTKDYNFKTENNNGEITTEKSVEETPAENAEDDETAEAAGFVDERVEAAWNQEDRGYRVTYDPDEIFVQIWSDGVSTKDDLDESALRDDVIPAWLNEISTWREELDSRGLDNVELCLQYISDNSDEDLVFFTIEGGELTYFAFDE
ncbi:MAG: hypothetical protein K5668_10145 [Lachnospiraceae bacterium]|nr:hypothetical protein [Lachnospiraceae bacterium]